MLDKKGQEHHQQSQLKVLGCLEGKLEEILYLHKQRSDLVVFALAELDWVSNEVMEEEKLGYTYLVQCCLHSWAPTQCQANPSHPSHSHYQIWCQFRCRHWDSELAVIVKVTDVEQKDYCLLCWQTRSNLGLVSLLLRLWLCYHHNLQGVSSPVVHSGSCSWEVFWCSSCKGKEFG